MSEWKQCPKCQSMNLNREACVDCGRDLKEVASEQPQPSSTAEAKPDCAPLGLLAAVKEIEWCVQTLKQHRQHWMMTKSLSVLPSDAQCGILVKTLDRAGEILKAANVEVSHTAGRKPETEGMK